MHIHRYERWWMTFGIAMLVVFLLMIGFAAFADNINPPSGLQQVDPQKLSQTPPFDKPGLRKLPNGTYEAYYVAEVFNFIPATLSVPVGSKVTFYVTSADVVHGFFIPRTDINMMAIPGWVNTQSHTFTRSGDYLLICHEYCGIGHQNMFARIAVH
ncbi:MAG: cytochrome c oxidase subunit II [Candidatus Eremiobacteraeota bacterium]|nr:cytochrome c oxidase subunit II [Candidatus Eremiobacteraeota bacterium]MBV9700824.1 cytochrome c oxidase subunit II [Candidatus Eremiobacteraeota bacterium]